MLYVVEIQRDRELFAMAMSAIREWLDAQRFEPEIFRCDSTEALVTFRLEFNQESEAAACADAFGASVFARSAPKFPFEPCRHTVVAELDCRELSG